MGLEAAASGAQYSQFGSLPLARKKILFWGGGGVVSKGKVVGFAFSCCTDLTWLCLHSVSREANDRNLFWFPPLSPLEDPPALQTAGLWRHLMRAARNRPRVVGFSRLQVAKLRAERPFPQARGRPLEPLGGGSATTELDKDIPGMSRALERMACYLRRADQHVCLLEGALWNGPGWDWADLVHKGPNSSAGPF